MSVNNLLNNALALWPEWADTVPNVVKELNNGLSNHSYLLEVLGQYYVLRLDTEDCQPPSVDRFREKTVQQLAAAAGISSPLIYQNIDQGVWVTEYIEGEIWSIDRLSDDGNITKLAECIGKVHALGAIDKHLDVTYIIQSYLDRLPKSSCQKSIKKHQDGILKLASELPVNRAVLCHNDLLVSNIIEKKSGVLKFIDWEYAAMIDPCFELAVIIDGQKFPENKIDIFIYEYLSRSVYAGLDVDSLDAEKQLLSNYRTIYIFIDALWHLLKAGENINEASMSYIDFQVNKLKQRL